MAYDEDLADRIRDVLSANHEVTEKKMFGGLAFLLGGRMAVAASSQGGLLVRIDPAQSHAILTRPGVRPMEMRGRPMQGWVLVEPAHLGTTTQVTEWVEMGLEYVDTLPPKTRRPRPGHLRQDEGMLTIKTVVMGVQDLQRAVTFWTAALHYIPKRPIEEDDDFVILAPESGHGTQLDLHVSETPVQPYPPCASRPVRRGRRRPSG